MYCVTWFWGIRRQRLLGITHRHRNTRKVTTCWKTNQGVYIHVRLKYKIYFYFKTIYCVTYRMSCKKSVRLNNINTFVFIPSSSWTSQWHIKLTTEHQIYMDRLLIRVCFELYRKKFTFFENVCTWAALLQKLSCFVYKYKVWFYTGFSSYSTMIKKM